MNPKAKRYSSRKKANRDDFYFDDCAICRGMKETEEQGKNLSLEELRALFKKQNSQN